MFFRKKTEETETDWIEGCRQNKPKSQEMLYKHYYSYAMTICLQYSKSEEEAAEILNDSFFKVFTKMQQYDTKQAFRAWLRKIIVHTAIDYYRRYHKNLYVNIEDIAPVEQDISVDILSTLSAEEIIKLLQRLKENQRIVFSLFEIEGYSHEEIADTLGITAGTSRATLSRAKAFLQQQLEKQAQAENLSN